MPAAAPASPPLLIARRRIPCPPSAPSPRSYAFTVWFPLLVQLRKELGELLVGLGLVGAALDLFEALELWDNLIVCYQLLGKRVQVSRRRGEDAWCMGRGGPRGARAR